MIRFRNQLPGEDTCSGCMACVDACPVQALSSKENKDGHLYADFDSSKCISCHKCEQVCPVINLPYANNDVNECSIFAAINRDDTLYNTSTSGGIFSALAKKILSEGGIVVGAQLDSFRVRHVCIESVDQLPLLQGSKYMESNMAGIYKEINNYLKAGRKVLYSGMGCQAAAVDAYFKKSKFRDQLFIVDIICGGVPSNLLADAFKNSEFQPDGIAHFREKNKYTFSYKKENEVRPLPLSEALPLAGFGVEATERYSCYNCQFTGVGRKADLTIGDLWGDTHTELKQKYDGRHLSVVIANNDRGMRLLDHCDNIDKELISWSVLLDNPRAVYGRSIKSKTQLRKDLVKNFNKYSYHDLCSLYGNGSMKLAPYFVLCRIQRLFYRVANDWFMKQGAIHYINNISIIK